MEKIEHEILTFIFGLENHLTKLIAMKETKYMFIVNFYMDLTKKNLNLQECAAKMISFYAKKIFL